MKRILGFCSLLLTFVMIVGLFALPVAAQSATQGSSTQYVIHAIGNASFTANGTHLASATPAVPANHSSGEIIVMLNGRVVPASNTQVDGWYVPPIIRDGRIYVRLDGVGMALLDVFGFKSVGTVSPELVITMIYSDTFGNTIYLDDFITRHPVIGPTGRTEQSRMIPLGDMLASIGYRVNFDATTNIFSIEHPLFDPSREHIVIRERQFFTQEELFLLALHAPNRWDTIHSTPHPYRAMTPAEVQAWSDEYFAMGGLNAQELMTIFFINEERIAAGVRPAFVCPYLSQAARLMSQLLMEQGVGGSTIGGLRPHLDPYYGGSGHRAMLFNPRSLARENLSGGLIPNQVVRLWMVSPGHRLNMLTEGPIAGTTGRGIADGEVITWVHLGEEHVGVGMVGSTVMKMNNQELQD